MRNHVRLVFAIVVAVVAIIVITRGVLLSMPRAAPTPVSASSASGVASRPEPVRTLSPDELEVDVASQGLPAVVDALQDTVVKAAMAIDRGRPAEMDAKVIAENASAYFGTVLGGSADDYVGYLDAAGGDPGVDLSDPANRKMFDTFYAELSGLYANGRISLEGVRVRPRVLGGRNIPQDDFGLRVGLGHAPKRYPALSEVAYDTPYGQKIDADTYEVLLPILYREGPEAFTVYLGLWMSRVPGGGGWLPSRIVTYSPTDARGVKLPVF